MVLFKYKTFKVSQFKGKKTQNKKKGKGVNILLLIKNFSAFTKSHDTLK